MQKSGFYFVRLKFKSGEILLRIVTFVTTLDFSDMKNVDKLLYFLGKAHKQKGIRFVIKYINFIVDHGCTVCLLKH